MNSSEVDAMHLTFAAEPISCRQDLWPEQPNPTCDKGKSDPSNQTHFEMWNGQLKPLHMTGFVVLCDNLQCQLHTTEFVVLCDNLQCQLTLATGTVSCNRHKQPNPFRPGMFAIGCKPVFWQTLTQANKAVFCTLDTSILAASPGEAWPYPYSRTKPNRADNYNHSDFRSANTSH